MHIEFLFFAVFIASCFYLFPRLGFVKRAGLASSEIRLLLLFKLLVSLACAFYFESLPFSDSLIYHKLGSEQYDLLLTNPVLFFTDWGEGSPDFGLGGIFEASYSFWADLRFRLLFKFVAILDLLTAGNFYLNSMAFSSIIFFGNIAFYRIYKDMYQGHKIKVLIICFLLPSILMYTACVHKDGLVFLFTALMSFIFYSFLKNRDALSPKFVLIFLFGMLGVFLFRNYMLLALLPAMFTAWLCKMLPYSRKLVIGISYSFYGILFFLSKYIHPSFNLAVAVVKRRADFASLGEGNTDVSMKELYPTVSSFLINVPQAINHSLFRPYLWEFPGFGVLLTALELFSYQVIVVLLIFFRNKKENMLSNYNVYGFAFFLTMILIIGYTIPNVGAIVRYRSIIWIFVLCPMICCIDWSRFRFWKANK